MDNHTVPHIDTNMGYWPGAVVSPGKEDQISRPCVSGRYIDALIEYPGCRGAGQV